MTDSLRQALNRLRAFFGKERLDMDLDEEMAAHLQLAIEENLRRGMSPGEARRQALIRFGGLEQAKERHREARGLPALDILIQDLRYSFRTLRRDRSFTLIAVLILAWVLSRRIAVVVSGLLLLATLVLALLLGWIGLVVFAVVAVLAFLGARCRGPGEEVAPRVGGRFGAVTRGHGPCRMGNGGENDGVGLRIVTRVGGEFRHETDQGSR